MNSRHYIVFCPSTAGRGNLTMTGTLAVHSAAAHIQPCTDENVLGSPPKTRGTYRMIPEPYHFVIDSKQSHRAALGFQRSYV